MGPSRIRSGHCVLSLSQVFEAPYSSDRRAPSPCLRWCAGRARGAGERGREDQPRPCAQEPGLFASLCSLQMLGQARIGSAGCATPSGMSPQAAAECRNLEGLSHGFSVAPSRRSPIDATRHGWPGRRGCWRWAKWLPRFGWRSAPSERPLEQQGASRHSGRRTSTVILLHLGQGSRQNRGAGADRGGPPCRLTALSPRRSGAYRDREGFASPAMLEHEIDIVALAGDVPDRIPSGPNVVALRTSLEPGARCPSLRCRASGSRPQQLNSLRLMTPLAPSDMTKSRLSSSEITPIALAPVAAQVEFSSASRLLIRIAYRA